MRRRVSKSVTVRKTTWAFVWNNKSRCVHRPKLRYKRQLRSAQQPVYCCQGALRACIFLGVLVTHSQSILVAAGGTLPAAGPVVCGGLCWVMAAVDSSSSGVLYAAGGGCLIVAGSEAWHRCYTQLQQQQAVSISSIEVLFLLAINRGGVWWRDGERVESQPRPAPRRRACGVWWPMGHDTI